MKSIITLFLAFILVAAHGQRYTDTYDPADEEVKSLLGKGNELNGFGGVDIKFSEMVSERALLTGAYGGLLVNRRYLLGLAGYGITTEIEFEGMFNEEPRDLNIYGGYGGILIGGMLFSKEVIHVTFPVLFGAGSLQVVDTDFFPNSPNDAEFTIEDSAFIVIEPAAQLEFNVTERFRVAGGMSYRFVTGSDLENLSDSKLSGSSITLSLRFGRF